MTKFVAKRTDGTNYTGVEEYKGVGVMRYCMLCQKHRPIGGGKFKSMMGGKHWICSEHQPKETK